MTIQRAPQHEAVRKYVQAVCDDWSSLSGDDAPPCLHSFPGSPDNGARIGPPNVLQWCTLLPVSESPRGTAEFFNSDTAGPDGTFERRIAYHYEGSMSLQVFGNKHSSIAQHISEGLDIPELSEVLDLNGVVVVSITPMTDASTALTEMFEGRSILDLRYRYTRQRIRNVHPIARLVVTIDVDGVDSDEIDMTL